MRTQTANQDWTHGSDGAKKHTKTQVTEQVSRISCDKDTIESGGERGEGGFGDLESCSQLTCLLCMQASAGLISTDSWGVKLSPHILASEGTQITLHLL